MISDKLLKIEDELFRVQRKAKIHERKLQDEIKSYFRLKYLKDPDVAIHPWGDGVIAITLDIDELTREEINTFSKDYELDYACKRVWFSNNKAVYCFNYPKHEE